MKNTFDSPTDYNLTGFAYGNTGGGVLPYTDAAYKRVYSALDFAEAIRGQNKYKIIEIMNDLDLGWHEISAEVKEIAGSKMVSHNTPLTHPVLIRTGVTKIYIDDFKNGLTIFSANGSTIKHAALDIRRSSNVIIRNLEFNELWEWDEKTRGDYDQQDWDYITLQDDHKVWIDHCTFHKAYDGIVDMKAGTSGVTISWSMFKSDDGAANGWVRQQLSAMEANRSQYPMYDFIRKQGISQVDIAAVVQGHKKTHLVGANPMEASNANLQLTLHHNYYHNAQDRMPRLRAGNAHIFNIMMECSSNWEVKNRIPNEAAKLIAAEGFHFDVISNGSLSTEGGALLIEQSYINGVRYPLRNNQQSGTPAAYTGKIKAEALKYVLGDLEFTGGSSDPDSPLGPNQAPIIPFSWNGFTTLPYSYKADFVPAIMNRLNSPTDGAGAGILKWDSQNWLRTSY